MKVFTIPFLLLAVGHISAQFPYTAEVLLEPYTSLQNPQSLGIELGWDDPEVEIPLPFEVALGDEPATMLLLSGTGEMVMGLTESGMIDILWPISLDVMDIGAVSAEELSLIQYQLTGTEPNRILKIEWNEVGLYEEISSNGTANLRLNFQVWIYESGNVIEYRFGPNTIANGLPDDFLTSGIILDFDYDYYNGLFYTASGSPSEPEWSFTDDFYEWYYNGAMLQGVPEDGTVYRFGPVASVAEAPQTFDALRVYPNPANESVWLENPTQHLVDLTLSNSMGQLVHRLQLSANQRVPFHVGALTPGLYTIQTTDHQGRATAQTLLIQ